MGSKIFAAAILGDINAVIAELRVGGAEVLLSKRSHVKGATVMHLAAMHGHTELVKELVRKYPRPQYVTECELHGRTPLHLAALNGKSDVVVELLKLPGVNPMCVDQSMHTPLLLAALNGHISVIVELLKSPHIKDEQLQQLNAANKLGHTALHLAVRRAHVNIVQFLLNSFESEEANIEQLICKPDGCGWTAVHAAAGMGRADILEEIFKLCWNRRIPVQLLNHTLWSPLHVASWLGHAEIVKLMCGKMGFPVNMTTQNLDRLTPLHMAANNGHDAVVDVLLRQGELLVGSYDGLRRTALHYAARQGHISVVSKLLMSSKSKSSTGGSLSVNATDVNGFTALHLAARGGHEEVVRILLEEGADVNARTEYSLVSKSLLDVVLSSNPPHETIIDPMALDADCCCISQMTPLHLAAKNGHIAVVRQLLKHPGVDIRALDGHGLMPQDWAEVREIKKVFLDCLEPASRSTAGETSAKVPKKKVQDLRAEMRNWEKLMAAVMPHPSTFHSFQSMQYATDTCEDLDMMGTSCGKHHGRASNSLGREDTRLAYDGDLDTTERLLQEIHEIAEQHEESGNTPLHVAVKGGQKKAVDFLLQRTSMDYTNVKNSEGRTPLAVAFENNDVEICKSILQNSERVEDDLHEMLETAMARKWLDMGVLLLRDERTRMGGSIDVNVLDEALHSEEKRFLDVLIRRRTVKERLLQERKEHLDSAGAMLGIAAIIASVTYQGVLQPPKGEHHGALIIFHFHWLNAIAFYSAVATMIAVASGSLPIRHMYELIHARDPMRMSRGLSCVLLIMSSACVVWAYAMAGFSRALEYNHPSSLVGINVVCTTGTTLFLGGFLILYIQHYQPFCRSSRSRSTGQQNEGYISIMCRRIEDKVHQFFRQENGGLHNSLLQPGNATVAV